MFSQEYRVSKEDVKDLLTEEEFNEFTLNRHLKRNYETYKSTSTKTIREVEKSYDSCGVCSTDYRILTTNVRWYKITIKDLDNGSDVFYMTIAEV